MKGKGAMKAKRYLGLALWIILAVSLAGCTPQPTAEESQTSQPEENTAPLLAEGETVTIDGICEFHVDHIEILDCPEFFPEAAPGKTYLDFCITYKHLADYIINAGNVMEGQLIYSGQYEYDGIAMAGVEEAGFFALAHAHSVEMEPSDTRQVHYFFTVPEEVQDSGRMVELSMSIRENDYHVIVREGEKGAVPGSANASSKASGAVEEGEAVATGNGEFYVEYAEFTKDVKPPNPGVAYRHYAAEDGKILLDFCIAYKNTSSQKIAASKTASVKLDQAEAHASVAEEGNRSQFEYSDLVNIIPLCTEYVHWVFQVPEEMASGGGQMTISFKIDGNSYTYAIR